LERLAEEVPHWLLRLQRTIEEVGMEVVEPQWLLRFGWSMRKDVEDEVPHWLLRLQGTIEEVGMEVVEPQWLLRFVWSMGKESEEELVT
jgi:hypothetical protein